MPASRKRRPYRLVSRAWVTKRQHRAIVVRLPNLPLGDLSRALDQVRALQARYTARYRGLLRRLDDAVIVSDEHQDPRSHMGRPDHEREDARRDSPPRG